MKASITLSVAAFLIVGLAAGPASATVLFTEDFSGHALDPGPGFTFRGGINGTNGWFLGHGTDNVRVSNTPVLGMVGNYGDMSPGQGSSDGNMHSNDAGIGGGMDPDAEYRLTWTQTVLADTSVEFGLRKGTRQHARLGLQDRFNNYAGRILLRGPEGDDTVSWDNHIGDGGTADFEMIITQDRVSFEINGVGVGGRQMDAATMAQIDGIHIWSDYSNNRNGGYIDNITLALESVFIPGDANGDGMVDVADLGVLGANFNQSNMAFADGDFNDDGIVDVADLGILGANWSASQATGNASALVPEPATLSLLAMSVLMAGRRRR